MPRKLRCVGSEEFSVTKLQFRVLYCEFLLDAAAAGSSNKLDLSVQLIKIGGGRLSVGRINRHTKPLALDNVNFELRNLSPDFRHAVYFLRQSGRRR